MRTPRAARRGSRAPSTRTRRSSSADCAARAIRTDVGIDLLCDAEPIPESLRAALEAAGAAPVSEAAAECLRIERGRPRYGIDLDDTVIPQEAGLNERAVSFTKGCYVGQETVARLHYRGKPNRHLRGLRLSAPAATGDEIASRAASSGSSRASPTRPSWAGSRSRSIRREAPPGCERHGRRRVARASVVEVPFR